MKNELGNMRVERTLKVMEKADIALLLCEDGGAEEKQWVWNPRMHITFRQCLF